MTGPEGRDDDGFDREFPDLDTGSYPHEGSASEDGDFIGEFVPTDVAYDELVELPPEDLPKPDDTRNTRHEIPDTRPVQAASKWLRYTQEIFARDPTNPVALRMLDEAGSRYYRALEVESRGRNEQVADAAAKNAELLAADITPTDIKDFLVLSAIVIGAAILSGATAGAVGAVLVKEVVSEEVVKGAVAGLITSTATIATERALAQSTQERDRSSVAAPASASSLNVGRVIRRF